jgi:two-component system, NarL family, sensor histidine kinase DesK
VAGRAHRKRITDQDIEKISGFNPYALLPWVLLVLSPAHAVMGGGYPRPVAALCGLGVFVLLYCGTIVTAFQPRFQNGRLPTVLALLLVPVTGALAGSLPHALLLYSLLAIAGAAVVPDRGGPLVLIGIPALAALTAYMRSGQSGDVIDAAWSSFLPGAITFVTLKLLSAVHQLRESRQELARTAVAEERLRFSRDLHDLLGHSMSVIALKAEVIRRLAPTDLDMALAQAADIEEVSRKALAEIREAVSGYRETGLSEELERAGSLLSAGGIEPVLHESGPPLPAQLDLLLAWVVREGVTNVVRHSRAKRCTIELERGSDPVRLSITDEGSAAGTASNSDGNGLQGLKERIAAGGGLLTAEATEKGFRLTAAIPAQRYSDFPGSDPPHPHETP